MNSERLSPLQIALLLLLVPLIACSYYYPHLIYRMGTRGWWVTIVASDAVIYGLVWVWLRLAQEWPQGTLVGVVTAGWGRLSGALILLPVAVPLWLSGIITIRELAVLMTDSLLPHTAIGVIFLVGLVTAWYIAYLGVKGIAHYTEVILILIALPLMVVLYGLAAENVKLIFLAPWWWIPDHLGVTGVMELPLAFSGLLALPTLLPYVDSTHQLKSGVGWALMAGTLVLLAGVAGPLGTLGPAAAEATPLPSLMFFNAAATAILFVQQLSYAMVTLWVVIFVGAAAFALWASARAASEMLGQPRITGTLGILVGLGWGINQAMPTIVQLRQIIALDGILTSVGLIWIVVWAIPLYILAKHHRREGGHHAPPS